MILDSIFQKTPRFIFTDDYSVEEERPIYAEETYYPNNEMSFEEQKML